MIKPVEPIVQPVVETVRRRSITSRSPWTRPVEPVKARRDGHEDVDTVTGSCRSPKVVLPSSAADVQLEPPPAPREPAAEARPALRALDRDRTALAAAAILTRRPPLRHRAGRTRGVTQVRVLGGQRAARHTHQGRLPGRGPPSAERRSTGCSRAEVLNHGFVQASLLDRDGRSPTAPTTGSSGPRRPAGLTSARRSRRVRGDVTSLGADGCELKALRTYAPVAVPGGTGVVVALPGLRAHRAAPRTPPSSRWPASSRPCSCCSSSRSCRSCGA